MSKKTKTRAASGNQGECDEPAEILPFRVLLSARQSGDEVLEAAARYQLAELGVTVTFDGDDPAPSEAKKSERRTKPANPQTDAEQPDQPPAEVKT